MQIQYSKSEIVYRMEIENAVVLCHIFHNSFQIYEAKELHVCVSTEVATGIV